MSSAAVVIGALRVKMTLCISAMSDTKVAIFQSTKYLRGIRMSVCCFEGLAVM